jgi:hypothetical protein
MTAPELTEDLITAAIAKADARVCLGSDRCFALPYGLADARETCTPKGRCKVGWVVSRGGRESFAVWLEVRTGLVKLVRQRVVGVVNRPSVSVACMARLTLVPTEPAPAAPQTQMSGPPGGDEHTKPAQQGVTSQRAPEQPQFVPHSGRQRAWGSENSSTTQSAPPEQPAPVTTSHESLRHPGPGKSVTQTNAPVGTTVPQKQSVSGFALSQKPMGWLQTNRGELMRAAACVTLSLRLVATSGAA